VPATQSLQGGDTCFAAFQVFAIIITLLVLEVHVPELTQGQSLNQALAEVRPSLVAFVVSFVLAGMYWVGLYATSRPQLLWQRLDARQRRAGLVLGVVPGLVYLLAFLVARSAPTVSLAIYAGLPVLYFLSITVLRGGRRRNQEYADFT
jgi:TMEM175 potassium channel family protein